LGKKVSERVLALHLIKESMKFLFFLISVIAFVELSAQNYQASDFTKENLFSENIEGPYYRNGILYVVNYQKDGTIGAVRSNGEVELFLTLPNGGIANAIQFDKKGNMFLADFKGHNILRVNHVSKPVINSNTILVSTSVLVLAHNDSFNQPNDLCINNKGQLFVSDPNWEVGNGNIWRVGSDGKTTLLKQNMGTTNGITLSPNQKILYVNESVQRKIWAFAVDKDGNLKHQRLFAEFDDYGLDGMKCDRNGNLYVTRYGKGTVVIFSPDGKIIREVKLKGMKPSNLTFGGIDGKTCYVTLQDRKCVEIFRSEVAGIKSGQ
jgi:gluconolactonase